MAPKIVPWLGELVASELRAVLQWKTLVKKEPDVEHVREGRFSDDGSNLRSSIALPSLGAGHRLQIVSVLSTRNLPTLLVSDGVTQMRALLSDDAIVVLEDEMGSSLEAGIHGDLFVVRELTIVSTPWGSEDRYVQICIEELEYVSHLRKAIGSPRPIENRPEILQLVQDIGDFRRKQNFSHDIFSDVPPIDLEHSPKRTILGPQSDRPNLRDGSVRLGNKRPRSGSVSSDELSHGHNRHQMATQIEAAVKKRSIAGPSHSGSQVASKADSSIPQRPILSSGSMQQKSITLASSSTLSSTQARLLHLLKPIAASRPDSFTIDERLDAVSDAQSRAVSSTQATDHPTRESSTLQKLDTSRSTQAAPPKVLELESVQPTIADSKSPDDKPAEPENLHLEAPKSLPHTSPLDSSNAYDGQFAPGSMSVGAMMGSMTENVPLEQQRLLDDPSCWLPSEIGRQLPVPNVPVQLISQWQIRHKAAVSSTKLNSDGSDCTDTSSEGDSSASTSTRNLISTSQWSPSPEPNTLPPDSSQEGRANVTSRTDVSQGGLAARLSPVRDGGVLEAIPPSQRNARTDLPLRSSAGKPQAKQYSTNTKNGHVGTGNRPYSTQKHTHSSSHRSSSYRDPRDLTPPGTDRYRPRYPARTNSQDYSKATSPDHTTIVNQVPQARSMSERAFEDDREALHIVAGASKEHLRKTSDSKGHRSSSVTVREKVPSDHHSSPPPRVSIPKPTPQSQAQDPLPLSISQIDRRDALSEQHPARELPQLHTTSPSTGGVQVKSTQFGNIDDLEMDIPRPLEDPTIIQRRKKREHFEALRRQHEERGLSSGGFQVHPSRRHLVDEGSLEALPLLESPKVFTVPHPGHLVHKSLLQKTLADEESKEINYPLQTLAGALTSQDIAVNIPRQSPTKAVKDHVRFVDLTKDRPEPSIGVTEKKATPQQTSNVRTFVSQQKSKEVDQTLWAQGQPLTTFREYAKAWNDVKPGGAFAITPQSTEQQRKNDVKNISALSWGWD